jgi:sulfopyruvate decarboxylase alpha subunit
MPTWPDEIYRVLKDAGIRQVAMVPDAGHSRLIRSFEADPETRVVTLTTEEEGVAMLAGAWLGGERGVLLLQSSGVGNCINMLSLPVICHMPLLMIVTMRGDWGEFNPWQIPMGQGTRPSLEAMGVIVNKVDEPDLVASTVQARRTSPSTAGSRWPCCSDSACSAPRTSRSLPANDRQSERTSASPRRRQRTGA